MYINPLNNGDISDYNSLKKQVDKGKIIKKFQSVKLQTKPTELQKYYQYLTYQQPILDELNYVAERMRTEDIKKKTEDYEFTEKLKIKSEGLMKETSKKEGEDIAREDLFDASSTKINDDITPVINTDVEMEYPTEPQPQEIIINNTPEKQALMSDLFGEGDTEPIKEDKQPIKINMKDIFGDNILNNNKSNAGRPKGSKSQKKAKKKYEEALKKYSISTDISDTMNRPIEKIKTLPEPSKNEISKELFKNMTNNMPINTDLQRKDKKSNSTIADTEKYSNIPKNKRKGGGRPKGSKNTPKRTLDLTK